MAYEASGWCFVEAAISAGVKPAKQRLDLGKRTEKALGRTTATAPQLQADRLVRGKAAAAAAAVEGARAAADGEDVHRQLGRRDRRGALPPLFRGRRVHREPPRLRQLQWGADEAWQLAAVLPRFKALTALACRRISWARRALKAIAPAIRVISASRRFVQHFA